MALMKVEHVCPSCGYRGLSSAPYAQMPQPPWVKHPDPPYGAHFGMPSFEVCSCCSFEFGNDDEPGTANAVTFDEHRRDWIARGCPWFDDKKRPVQWSFADQLRSAGL